MHQITLFSFHYRGVDIHHVHNGIDMSHGKHATMQQFRRVAAMRKREENSE